MGEFEGWAVLGNHAGRRGAFGNRGGPFAILRAAVPALLATLLCAAPAGAQTVRNLELGDEGGRVVLTYDLEAPGPTSVQVVGSGDGGATWALPVRTVTGDAGPAVHPGRGKRILWDLRADHPAGLDDREVVLDVRLLGSTDAPAAESGSDFYVIPAHGVVGAELTRVFVERCLAEADRAGAPVVVLDLDSPGGVIADLFEIADALAEWRRRSAPRRLIAFVRHEALSAAAILATACPEIYVAPGSVLGAALAVQVQGHTVTAVDEKFSSVFRGKARTVAEGGGHDPSLVMAMVDPAVVLSLARDGAGKPVVLEGSPPSATPATYPVPPRLLVDRDKLLTLTASEAVESGLARAVAADWAELGERLGSPGWSGDTASGASALAERRAEVERLEADWEFLMETVNLDLQDLRQGRGAQLLDFERTLLSIQDALTEIETLAQTHRFLGMKFAAAFPKGTGELRGKVRGAIDKIQRARR